MEMQWNPAESSTKVLLKGPLRTVPTTQTRAHQDQGLSLPTKSSTPTPLPSRTTQTAATYSPSPPSPFATYAQHTNSSTTTSSLTLPPLRNKRENGLLTGYVPRQAKRRGSCTTI